MSSTAVFGIYPDQEWVSEAVDALKRAGFSQHRHIRAVSREYWIEGFRSSETHQGPGGRSRRRKFGSHPGRCAGLACGNRSHCDSGHWALRRCRTDPRNAERHWSRRHSGRFHGCADRRGNTGVRGQALRGQNSQRRYPRLRALRRFRLGKASQGSAGANRCNRYRNQQRGARGLRTNNQTGASDTYGAHGHAGIVTGCGKSQHRQECLCHRVLRFL